MPVMRKDATGLEELLRFAPEPKMQMQTLSQDRSIVTQDHGWRRAVSEGLDASRMSELGEPGFRAHEGT